MDTKPSLGRLYTPHFYFTLARAEKYYLHKRKLPSKVLLIRIKLNNVNTTALLDTGASLSLIARDKATNFDVLDQDILIHGFAGKQLALEKSTASLDIAGSYFTHDCIVTDKLRYSIVLGTDFLTSHEVEISFATQEIRIGNIVMPFYTEDEKVPEESSFYFTLPDEVIPPELDLRPDNTITALHDVVLSPMSQGEIPIYCPIGLTAETYLDPPSKNQLNVLVLPQFIEDLKVNVFNLNNFPVKIHAGSRLGTSHHAESMYSLHFEALEKLDDETKPSRPSEMTRAQSDSLNINPKLPDNERRQIKSLLNRYADCFSWNVDDVGHFKYGPPLDIDTGDSPPVVIAPYALGSKEKEMIDSQVQAWLKAGIIRPSNSNYSAPIFLVPKAKPGEYRLCVNFKFLNSVTKGHRHPLPLIPDLFQKLKGSNYFSTLDFNQGFLMFDVAEEDRYKTAFSTDKSHYEFCRVPFGIAAGPTHFSRLMKIIFSDFINVFIVLFIDDLTVYSRGLDYHLKHLEKTLKRIRRANITLRAVKCNFGFPEIPLLGHVVNGSGLKPSPKLINAIKMMPIPCKAKDVRAVLGLAGYYRQFIPHFAQTTLPLNELTKKGVKFKWDDQHEKAFRRIKESVSESTFLSHFDDSRDDVQITTDGSKLGLGAILQQTYNDQTYTIAFASRALRTYEKNYTASELEALAVYWALIKFRHFIFGRKITVFTDHSALCYLTKQKKPHHTNPRLLRWCLLIQGHDIQFVFLRGKHNVVADALSRLPWTDEDQEDTSHEFYQIQQPLSSPDNYFNEITELGHSEICSLQRADGQINKIIESLEKQRMHADPNNTDNSKRDKTYIGLVPPKNLKCCDCVNNSNSHSSSRHACGLCRSTQDSTDALDIADTDLKKGDSLSVPMPQSLKKAKAQFSRHEKYTLIDSILYRINYFKGKRNLLLMLPSSLLQTVIAHYHDNFLSGHLGVDKTLYKLRRKFYAFNMDMAVINYIRSCPICQRIKQYRGPATGPLQLMPVGGLFERFSIDAIGPLTTSESGNKHILVAVEYSTRFCVTQAVKAIDTATITNFVLEHIILKFGCPRFLQTDNASTFRSHFFSVLTEAFKIEHVFSSPYSHGTQGVVERRNQSLEGILRSIVNLYGTNWDTGLQSATFAINAAPNVSSKFAPFFLLYGTNPTFALDLLLPETILPSNAVSLKELDRYRKIAVENIRKAQEQAKIKFDKKHVPVVYPINSLVLIKIPSYKAGLSRKLAGKYHGPYKVVAQLSPIVYRIERLNPNGKSSPRVINVRLMRPYYLRPHSALTLRTNKTTTDEGNIFIDSDTEDQLPPVLEPEDIDPPQLESNAPIVKSMDVKAPEPHSSDPSAVPYFSRYGRLTKRPQRYQT